MADLNPSGDRGFPSPYVHTVKENEPIMKRVDFPHMGIGSRPTGTPTGGTGGEMKIDHVGGKAG